MPLGEEWSLSRVARPSMKKLLIIKEFINRKNIFLKWVHPYKPGGL